MERSCSAEAERRASAAAGSRSDVGAEAGGSRLHALVRRRFWHSIPPSLDTQSFLPPLALTAPCMRTLALQIMRLSAPPAIPSHLSHRWTASADEPIGLVQHHWVNGESQSFCGLQIDDELDFCVRLHRDLLWLRPLENLVHQARRLPA
jgi:hypothetical protein